MNYSDIIIGIIVGVPVSIFYLIIVRIWDLLYRIIYSKNYDGNYWVFALFIIIIWYVIDSVINETFTVGKITAVATILILANIKTIYKYIKRQPENDRNGDYKNEHRN